MSREWNANGSDCHECRRGKEREAHREGVVRCEQRESDTAIERVWARLEKERVEDGKQVYPDRKGRNIRLVHGCTSAASDRATVKED